MERKPLTVNIGNTPVELNDISSEPALSIDNKFRYDFYSGTYKGFNFVAVNPKNADHESPMQLQRRKEVLKRAFGKDIVFIFDNLAYYERERLTERDVYFIVSGKYAFLPFLWINAKEADSAYKRADKLLPPGQYILLWHLQKRSLEGMKMNDAVKCTGISQPSVSRAFAQLSAMGLVCLKKIADRSKIIHFNYSGKDLWEKALPLMSSPVDQIWYCDTTDIEDTAIAGINALSKYSALNPEDTDTVAMTKEQFAKIKQSIPGLNRMDGNTRIEVWKYRPLAEKGLVDKLSLYLSLRDDNDPRVEKELEIMIDKLWL